MPDVAKPETIAAAYEGYRQAILLGAPDIQVEECRRAFMAGAYFLLSAVSHFAGDEQTSEDAGVAYLEALKAEAETFARTLRNPTPEEHAAAQRGKMQYTTPDPDGIQPLLQRLGDGIGKGLPVGYGFALQIFTFGPGGALFYISNADRGDMVRVMREFIARQTA